MHIFSRHLHMCVESIQAEYTHQQRYKKKEHCDFRAGRRLVEELLWQFTLRQIGRFRCLLGKGLVGVVLV